MKNFFFILMISLAWFTSCNVNINSDNVTQDKSKLSFACWNVQTFFDAEIDGVEYEDFRNYSKWSKEKYLTRLSRLCHVMTTLNADVFVFEEIENEAVVQDVANQFAGKAWSKKNNWSYAAFTKNSGDAIGFAVFSKFPLENFKVHNLDIRTQSKEQPQMRSVWEFVVDVDGRDLVVLANHWKSKSGGEEETEIWRDWQELVCANVVNKICFENGNSSCVLCGDFNRDVKDFVCDFTDSSKKTNTVLRGVNFCERVYSPWFTDNGNFISDTGSYFYKDNWSRIDNIFSCGNLTLSSFGAKTEGNWCSSSGVPNGYKIYTGEGFSDHLPIMCVIIL